MRIIPIYFGIISFITGLAFFGFNISGSMTADDTFTERNWGLNATFVQMIVQQMKGPNLPGKNGLIFQVHIYHDPSIDQKFSMSETEDVAGDDSSDWITIYERTIQKRGLLTAGRVDELIEDYPFNWMSDFRYTSVWIKTLMGGESISMMSKSNELSQEQKAMFKLAGTDTNFDIVINYSITDSRTMELTHKRINIHLTLIPEKNASFPEGYEKLITYFEENSKKHLKGINVDNINNVRIRFIIGVNGKAEEINQTSESGIRETDDLILELIRQMPAWIPAKDADGTPVKQEFELIFGRPGC